MSKSLEFEVFEEDGIFVAQCHDVEVASDGITREEAIANLAEALSLYFNEVVDLSDVPPTQRH